MKRYSVVPEQVEIVPEQLTEGVLYVSHRFSLVVHLCCCGCGGEVVTPLSPAQWHVQIERDGAVSLSPSVGNWGLACRSHYWIRGNQVAWAGAASDGEIAAVRRRDRRDLARYLMQTNRREGFRGAVAAVVSAIKQAWHRAVARIRRR